MATPAAAQLQDDRFLLLETLGRGGMAAVYRAFDRVSQRFVALKVQLEDEPGGPQHPFAAEFEAWSRLSHPNVVQALELARSSSGPIERDRPYLVLEHVAGGPAHQVLRPGRETPGVVESFAVQVLRGLGHVHQAGLVHRDLKPSNILVGTGPEAERSIKLTDFGLATPLGQADEPGRISGSLPYVSPEALCGQPVDERADLYGLGILLYLLTTGEMPLPGAGPDELVRWHLTGPPPDPTRAGWRGPQRLARFIRRLTERSRDARPHDSQRALALLGPQHDTPDVAHAVPGSCSRSERARLRLALDAVRLGAVRVLRAPRVSGAAFRREAGVAAQVLGLGFYEIRGRPQAQTDLDSVAVQLLSGCCPDPAGTVLRFGLQRTLRLALVGNLPVLDRTAVSCPLAEDRRGGDSSAELARFFLACADHRALALLVGPEARAADPRVAGLCRELRRAAGSGDRPRPGRGGLLLLVD